MYKFAFVTMVMTLAIISGSQGWPYGKTKIRGANLGSWLILEKWMTPAVFEGTDAEDEWQLCQKLGPTEAAKRLRAHWDTWVTEKDIIALKNAGINHLRIPIGYWAIEIPQGEPWVSGSWDYVMKAIGWAKTHGLQVMVDLHAVPGSQNGQDHSGRKGSIGFFNDDKNINLAIRVITEMTKRVSTTQWRGTVTIIELLNEPNLWADYNYRLDRLKKYYLQAYDVVRAQNTDIVVAVHDAFISHDNWYYMANGGHYNRVMVDAHYYQVFGDEWANMTCDQHANAACRYAKSLPTDESKLWTVVGEWSLATPSPCPKTIKTLARQQIGVYEKASGWFMWNFKHAQGWNEWDFLASVRLGWINLNNSTVATC